MTRTARLIEELRRDNAALREVNAALLWHMNHCPPPCGAKQAGRSPEAGEERG